MEKRFEGFPGIFSIIRLPKSANLKLAKPLPYWIANDIYSMALHGWTAHSIFDDIRDEGSSSSLSIANGHMNEMAHIRSRLDLNIDQESMIVDIFRKMEHANFLEECNIADRGYIYTSSWKSMGAAVPLIVLLMKAGSDKRTLRMCLSYFYHMIAARQLSDDATDWWDDLMKRRSTLVTHLLIDRAAELRSEVDHGSFKRIFDERIAPVIAKRIAHHSNMSISFAKKMRCFTDTEFLQTIPKSYLNMSTDIIDRYNNRKSFEEIFWRR